MEKNSQLSCEHPQLILNPNIADLIGKYHHYFLNGRWYENRFGKLNHYKFDKRPFNQLLAKKIVNLQNYENNFITDFSDGSAYPIYIAVPCGHCTLCKEKKVNSFVSRIKYESFLYPYQPLFITLTYNDKWLPSDGVSLRDVQLFFKRFRQNLSRGGYTHKIRYVLVAEYGRRTHRAHYHAIIFGLPITTDRDLRRFEDILNKSWQLGFTLSRQINCADDRCFYYTSKYLRKQCAIPKGCKNTFSTSSKRGGGLGTGFLKKQAEQIRKRPQPDIKYLNPWTNKCENLVWSKFALDKIFPTISTSIPLKLRKALYGWCRCYNTLKATEPDLLWLYETTHIHVKSKFGDILWLPLDGLEPHEFSCHFYDPSRVCDINEFEPIIKQHLDLDFSHAPDLEKNRAFLISKLSLNQCDVDLVQKVARIKRNIKHLENFEIL